MFKKWFLSFNLKKKACDVSFFAQYIFLQRRINLMINEPSHDKTNKVSVHPAKTQHQPSLIRVFAVRSMGS